MSNTIPSCLLFITGLSILTGCGPSNTGDSSSTPINEGTEQTTATLDTPRQNFTEGTDYMIYERVRIFDKAGFSLPAEAYSILLPKGWTYESDIIWNQPGTECTGTFGWFKATSPDRKFSIEILPEFIYTWNSNPQMIQIYTSNPSSSKYCSFREPLNAEQYLRSEFVNAELNNAQIIKVEPNPIVVDEMRKSNQTAITEMQQYGAGEIRFDQTAVNAEVRWPDNTEGMVILGSTIVETGVPNVYNGSVDFVYTTQFSKRTIFKYPAGEKEKARDQLSVIMGSIRTNPWWSESVNKYWKDVRAQRQREHIGKIAIMDAQTRAIGEAAIAKGNQRLKEMDNQMRNWEATQSSQDRIHTNFIKTIREVENYRDETGKYEMTSGYDHAWSRGDGTTFMLSNNPNFDPSSVFQDQNWKEMKKVND